MQRIFRLASLSAALCLCVLLSGCRLTGLHVVIPDFSTSTVRGVRVYRVEEGTGRLVDAGRIVLGVISKNAGGEIVRCTHFAPDGKIYGPLEAVVTRPQAYPTGIEVRLPFTNTLGTGWFHVASYNAKGTSRPSVDRIWVI